jgi:hypothetical protein
MSAGLGMVSMEDFDGEVSRVSYADFAASIGTSEADVRGALRAGVQCGYLVRTGPDAYRMTLPEGA